MLPTLLTNGTRAASSIGRGLRALAQTGTAGLAPALRQPAACVGVALARGVPSRSMGSVLGSITCRAFATVLALGAMAAGAHGQVAFTGSYTQDFNSLPTTGSVTWTQNSTLPNWFTYASTATPTSIAADAGSTNGGFFSYGTGAASDRALGAIPTNAIGNMTHAVLLRNDSGGTITSITVQYTGEQWRDNVNATANTLIFGHQVFSSAVFAPASAILGGGYTIVSALNFTSPKNTASGSALDGNAAANRTVMGPAIISGLNWTAGDYLVLRWIDTNDANNDQGLGIDDLSVTAVSPANCSITTVGGTGCVGANRLVSVSVTDTPGPVPDGTSVQLTVTGANPGVYAATTNAGVAVFGYTGISAGVDSFASSGTVNSHAFSCSLPNAVTWTALPGAPTGSVSYSTAVGVPVTMTVSVGADQTADWSTSGCGGSTVPGGTGTLSLTVTPGSIGTTTYNVVARSTSGACSGASGTACLQITLQATACVDATVSTPASQSVCAGSTATFTVTAGGTGPFSYQWKRNGGNVGTDNPSYTTPALSGANNGDTYTCDVLGSCGPIATSGAAALTVLPQPSTALSVTALNSSVCFNQGTSVVVGASEPGVSYQLRVGGTPVVGSNAVTGTGNAINLLTGALTSTTTFNVFATPLSCPGAGVQLAQTATVMVDPLPATPSPTTATSFNAVAGVLVTLGASAAPDEEIIWFSGTAPCGTTAVNAGVPSNGITVTAAQGTTNYFARARKISTGCTSATCLAFTVSGGSQVVISQVYGAGGNSGATYKTDFVELFNRGAMTFDISGYSLQFAQTSDAFTSLNIYTFPGAPGSGTTVILPGRFALIPSFSGTSSTGEQRLLPATTLATWGTSDILTATNGKVALASNSSVVTGPTAANVVDFVGYGSANQSEGGSPAGAISTILSAFRKSSGCVDTNNNSADFATGTPRPRSSASPICNCAGGLTETITDTTSTAATLNGTIATDEYGPGNSYMFAGDGNSMGGVLGYNRADLTRARVFMNSSLTGLNIAVRTGATITADRTIVILLDTKPGGSTSSPTFTDNGVLPNGDAGKSAASRALRAARPPTFGVDYVLIATASGGTTIDSSLYAFNGTALSLIMTTSSSGSSTSVGVTEMAIPYTAIAPFTPGGNIDFIATLSDGVVTGAGSSMSDETIPVNPALTGSGSQGTSGGTLTNFNRFITFAPVACCAASGACTYVAASDCTSGTVGNSGSVCTPNTCPQQACCTPQGVCSLATEGACTIGSTLGTGYTCSPNPCPQVACCTPSIGTCVLSVDGVCGNGTTALAPGSTCEPNLCAVDCQLSTWSNWGACSLPCGGGTRIRTRTVVVAAANGGAACDVLEESEPCNSQPCPIDCVVGAWSDWSACTATCGGGMQTRTRTVLVPAQFGGAACGSLSESRACNEQPCPIDCVVSAWSDWSTCTATCDGGMQTRTRTVLVPAQFGGAACGSLSESRSCNEQPCPVNCVVSAWSDWSACTATCGGGTRTRTRTVITPAANGGMPCPDLEETESCNSQPCGTTGACCIGNTCTITAEIDCTGTWLGADTQCTAASVMIELAGISAGPVNRCITFDFYTSASCTTPAYTIERVLTFTGGIATTAFSTVPCGVYTALAVRDRLHTLRRVASAAPAFDATNPASLVAVFTSGSDKALKGGNVNNDGYIDILDFGGYIGRLSQSPGADTSCSTSPIHPDFSGDGSISTEDFTFIQGNFLAAGDADPCGPLAGDSPITDISVIDLVARGEWDIARGDLNLDGRLNAEDIAFLATNGPAVCSADINSRSGVTIQDVFDYVRIWMDGHPAADTDRDQHLTVQDIFTYLSIWFAGC